MVLPVATFQSLTVPSHEAEKQKRESPVSLTSLMKCEWPEIENKIKMALSNQLIMTYQ